MQKKRQGKMSERQRKKLKNMKTKSNLSQIKWQPAGSKLKKIMERWNRVSIWKNMIEKDQNKITKKLGKGVKKEKKYK